MPVYEYFCETCGTHFEHRQGFNGPPAETCPNGHPTIRRIFTPPAIVFKGPGFYVTDNRKNGNGTKTSSSETQKETAKATSGDE